MLIPNKFNGYHNGTRQLHLSTGGGGGGPTQTNVQNTNVPEYARPYVETMLGATQQQLFQGNRTPITTNPETGVTTGGEFNITGFRPYQAYGGTYDAQGKQLSYDPSAAIAGFTPDQLKTQQGIMGMQTPYHFNRASQFVGDLGQKMAGQNYTPGYNASVFNKYQMNGVDDVTTGKFDQAAADQYMNPYMQSVVDIQKREANRQAGQMAAQNAAKFAGAGAFGGSRQAIAMAEADRNLSQQMGDIQATGSNQAYQQALQQFNTDQARSLAAAQGNQSKNLSMGQANLQALLSTQAQQEQARQFQEQANQFGANYGLQSQQAALGAMRDYTNYGQMGFNAQKDIYGMQNQIGQQQQQYRQSIINQAVQDYANAQQYPLMQLGTMSNMLRGLPMQASSTQQYQAQPSMASQAIGAIGAGTSLFNAMKAEGGVIKGYAKGGIMSYDMGGEVEEQLENMDEKGLATQARESSSPSVRRMAQRILRERQMSKQSQGTGPMGVQYQAAQPQMSGYAPGGIVAFAQGKTVYGGPSTEANEGEAQARDDMEKRLAMPPTTEGGIMGATVQPRTPVPTVSKPNAAMQQAANIPAFMKAQYEEADKRMNAPLSDFMAERKAALQEAGVADIAEGQRLQRAALMAEKANMNEEKERQKYMRMAEFFAAWGSTPGPTLVAGMNALKQSVPGIIADEKEQKKARREIDKSIADLDNAARLEKRGEVDAAMALKLKAADNMKALQGKLIDYQSQRERDEAGLEGHRISAKGQVDAASIRNRGDAATRAQTEALRNEDRVYGRYQAATKQYNDVVADVARQESQDAHKNDLKKLEQYTMGAKDKKTGEINPNKINKEYRVPYAETLARVNARRTGWESAIRDAQTEKNTAYARYTNLGGPAAAEKPKGAPKVSLDDPSLQKQ